MSRTKPETVINLLDYLIDRIHELVEQGLVAEATSLYEEYSELFDVYD